jgi:hypothetical protein
MCDTNKIIASLEVNIGLKKGSFILYGYKTYKVSADHNWFLKKIKESKIITIALNGRQKLCAFIPISIYIQNNLVNAIELPALLPPLMHSR